MNRPTKAILLAAGLGVRMRPLTNHMPKAMLPLWGKPIIGHVIDLVRDWGVREILVNAHHAPDPLVRYLLNRSREGVAVNISFEPELLGTGGALKRAAWFAGKDPFWVINTDIALDLSPLPFLAAFRKTKALAALWVDATKGPRTVEVMRRKITTFRSNRPGSDGTYTFCGLQLVSPNLLHYFPGHNEFSLVDIYDRAMAAGETVLGIDVPRSYWSDLGTPERYLAAHGDVLDRFKTGQPGNRLLDRNQYRRMQAMHRHGIFVSGFASSSSSASVGKGVRIRQSVIWDKALVGAGCRLNNAIVADNASVSGHAEGVVVRCIEMAEEIGVLEKILGRLKWDAGRTTAVTLGARGSDRTFIRLQMKGKDVILIRYGTTRVENTRYASHARFLKRAGVPVPLVLVDLPDEKATVLEYIAGPSLESLAKTVSGATLEKYYQSVLDALLVMHGIPSGRINAIAANLEPGFSTEVYAWERELMARHFMRGRLHLVERTIRPVLRDLESVAARLAEAPSVLVHRDFQSSNIIWRRRGPVFIDFQGMRQGPAVYDLASLLCDPYVMLDAATQSRLLQYYASRTNRPEQIISLFWMAGVQRLAQALGAFARLGAMPGTRDFARHIRPGLIMMNRALEQLDGLAALRSLVQGLLQHGCL